ncbi:GNAT family N-acetyltransferase [Nigerium massiliense]|uniref:GNAT family N-acetyltransferase n=1 Tax=Nigerium massiliense TaxID=1522317 RepID=UPI0036F4197D
MIRGLFVGWPAPPSPATLIRVMEGSFRRVWAIEDQRVVGYINAISDGVLNAFIPWLEVHPDYQGRGIGRELVTRLVAELQDMYAIDLLRPRVGALLRAPGLHGVCRCRAPQLACSRRSLRRPPLPPSDALEDGLSFPFIVERDEGSPSLQGGLITRPPCGEAIGGEGCVEAGAILPPLSRDDRDGLTVRSTTRSSPSSTRSFRSRNEARSPCGPVQRPVPPRLREAAAIS